LLVEAVATLVAGVCGGVAQTTPYIGQPAYKHMGARSGYTLLAGLFVGLGGMLGVVAGLVELLPLAVLAPIIVYVALDIAVQAFDATPRPHWPAVALAFLPAIAYLLAIKLGNPTIVPPERFAQLYADAAHGIPELAVTVMLGNGFILTAMLWAAALVALIDAHPARAAGVLFLAAGLAAFGVIHSVHPAGGLYLPWTLAPVPRGWMLQFAGAYVVLAALLLALRLLARPVPGK
jgi:AGZA family xanthine/uracil permease-like MFS transporter